MKKAIWVISFLLLFAHAGTLPAEIRDETALDARDPGCVQDTEMYGLPE